MMSKLDLIRAYCKCRDVQCYVRWQSDPVTMYIHGKPFLSIRQFDWVSADELIQLAARHILIHKFGYDERTANHEVFQCI